MLDSYCLFIWAVWGQWKGLISLFSVCLLTLECKLLEGSNLCLFWSPWHPWNPEYFSVQTVSSISMWSINKWCVVTFKKPGIESRIRFFWERCNNNFLSVQVSWGCHTSSHKVGGLKQRKCYPLSVLEVGSPWSRCRQVCAPSGGSSGEAVPASSSVWGLQAHLACGHILPVSAASSPGLPPTARVYLSCLCLSLIKITMMAFRFHLNHPGCTPHLKILHLIMSLAI